MAEVYDNQFTRDLSSNYTAGSGTLVVSSAAPVSVQGGTFRVRLANASNTLLKVTGGASTTTWTVEAEANDANATAGADMVLGCEVTAGFVDAVLTQASPFWASFTDPTTVSFAWRNQGGASVTARYKSIYLAVPAVAGDQYRGREITAPAAPVSITAGFVPHLHDQNYNQFGIYVTDGTKLISASISDLGNPGGNFAINQYTNVTTFSSTPAAPKIAWMPTPIFLKVVDDGTNLKWFWSPNGQDFIQVYSAARLAWLASVSAIGFFANSNNGTYPCGCVLVSWAQGTS